MCSCIYHYMVLNNKGEVETVFGRKWEMEAWVKKNAGRQDWYYYRVRSGEAPVGVDESEFKCGT